MQFLFLVILGRLITNQLQLLVPLQFSLLDITVDVDWVVLFWFFFAIKISEAKSDSPNNKWDGAISGKERKDKVEVEIFES